MVHDPVEQGHDATNTIHFSVHPVSTQSRRKWYRNVNFIIVLSSSIGFTYCCWQVIWNVHSTIKECLWRFISITCAAKLSSNVKLELTCSNNGVAMW